MKLKISGAKMIQHDDVATTRFSNFSCLVFLTCFLSSSFFLTGHAIASTNDFERIPHLAKLPYPVSVSADGELRADKSKWTLSKESDGTELLTSKAKEPTESRIAVIRSKASLESFTSYSLKPAVGMGTKPETSSSVFFEQGKLAAFTHCVDTGTKESIGRTCVTATPKLCQSLKKSDPIESETMQKVDSFEMRAIATILTLRGADHQLDNVVRTGNRLGLKSALQTTKGQLVALSKQISKELTNQSAASNNSNTTATREPANVSKSSGKNVTPASALSTITDEKKIVVSADTSQGALEEEAKTRSQLEHTIPMLQQACADTGFASSGH